MFIYSSSGEPSIKIPNRIFNPLIAEICKAYKAAEYTEECGHKTK